LAHFFYDFVITFDTILMKNMHNCKKAVVPELRARSASAIALLFKPVFEQIATSIKPFFSFSPRKKLRVRFENGKIFSDSRGNRQANWNLDNFLHLFTPCNLPSFGDAKSVTWKSWRLARQFIRRTIQPPRRFPS